jgi:hypothetical protein
MSEPIVCDYKTRGDCSPRGPRWYVSYERTTALGTRKSLHHACDTHAMLDVERADPGTLVRLRRVCPECGSKRNLVSLPGLDKCAPCAGKVEVPGPGR